jgi:hypothetical protein
VRDLSELSEDDLFWDPDSVSALTDETLTRKMGQTYLSRISYHRRQVRKTGPLKLSQQIGLLLWLNRHDLLSVRGEERLLFLQSKAPLGALDAGLKFVIRLEQEPKLRSDLYHWMVVLNCFPSTKRFRAFQARRMGIGYRDKGTLPSTSVAARREAETGAWVHQSQIPDSVRSLLFLQPSLSEGEWVDLPELVLFLQQAWTPEDLHLLLGL